MDDCDEDLRQQLTEAIASCRRQIDVDNTPDAMTNFQSAGGLQTGMAALRTELASLEASLAELDAKAAVRPSTDPDPEMSVAMADAEAFNETHPDAAADADDGDEAEPAPVDAGTPARVKNYATLGMLLSPMAAFVNMMAFGRLSMGSEVFTVLILAAVVFAGSFGAYILAGRSNPRAPGPAPADPLSNQPPIVS